MDLAVAPSFLLTTWSPASLSLSVTSVGPYFALSALLLLVATGLARYSAFYRDQLVAEASAARFHSIDGLRGHLALGVFFHHAVIRFFYHVHGRWETPPSRLYTDLGQAGVALFFMITAFLFWNKGLKARPTLNVQIFLWTRVPRLVPMYLFSVLLVFVVAFASSGPHLRDSFKSLVTGFLSWASFGFVVPGAINGAPASDVINNVYWSLRYEWVFYLVLPLALIFSRGRAFIGLLIVSALFIQAFSVRPIEWCFLFGMVAAVLNEPTKRLPVDWRGWPVGVFALACLVSALGLFDSTYSLMPITLLACFFFCVANGNTLFGLLRLRASRFLGTISYSIYLLHCIVLHVVFQVVGSTGSLADLAPDAFWLMVALCGVATVLISTVTFRFVEFPGMQFRLPTRSQPPRPAPSADTTLSGRTG